MARPKSEHQAVRSETPIRSLADIGLTHGSAMWVLRELGFSQGASELTFNYYVKSLRKLGIPFAPGQNRYWSGRLARYKFDHLMELALALTLRVYGTLPDSVLEGMIRYRDELRTIYLEAYESRHARVTFRFHEPRGQKAEFALYGLYLDLQILFSGGRLVSFGPPRALRPCEAIQVLLDDRLASRASIPIHISRLAERVVDGATCAPDIRRGPVPHAMS